MLKYLIKRVGQSLFTLFIISILIVLVVHLIPGGPAQAIMGSQASEKGIEQINEQLGLNKPLYQQYIDYYSGIILHGDFGESFVLNTSVATLLEENLPITFIEAFCGLGIAVLIGVPFGLISGLKRNTIVDEILTTFSFIGLSVPSFVWGILFILIFGLKLGWLPTSGYVRLTENWIAGIKHLILPILSIGIVYSTVIVRYTRSEVMGNLNKPYYTALKAKGLSPFQIYLKLVRNSLIPVVTVVGLSVGSLISAAVVIEIVFAIPGSGKILLSAIVNSDYPVLQGFVLIIAITYMAANLIVDILYTYLDPRITY